MNLDKRYFIDSSGKVLLKKFVESLIQIPMDSIVDKTHFRPDSELVRTSSLSGSGLGAKGVFDDSEHLPTDFEVSMRSGKFDKAEIGQRLKESIKDSSKIVSDDINHLEVLSSQSNSKLVTSDTSSN